MYIDTHAHLDFPEFDSDRAQAIRRAKEAGVEFIINIGTGLDSSAKSVSLAKEYDFVYAAIGVHPHDSGMVTEAAISRLRELAGGEKVVAVGEVGLDYFRLRAPKEKQKEAFKRFISLAQELGLPMVIHSRDAHEDMLDILKKEASPPLRGVLHCFSGGFEFAEECVGMGFYISFTCNLTYPNAVELKEVARRIPIEKILLETDSPFLPPQAYRGKRNEPSYIGYLAQALAQLKGLSVEDVARITTLNAKALFGIGEISQKGAIAYPIRDSLYLNITNRCTDDCSFCVRNETYFVKGHNLRILREPTLQEILDSVPEPAQYKEIVFCGLGEPFLRLDVIKEAARKLKERGARYIRIDTNGHGNLIHGRSVVADIAGLIDEVCVSFHVDTKEKYNEICKPRFGEDTFERLKEFVLECKRRLPKVTITVLDMPGVDVENFKRLAAELGVEYRIRKLGAVG